SCPCSARPRRGGRALSPARLYRWRAQPARMGHAQSFGPNARLFCRVADGGGAGKARKRRFSALFGTFNRLFLKDQEGLSLLILESDDARADAARFRSAGISVSDAMRFEREGKRPDGSMVKVGFSLAFARDGKAPAIGFFAS